MTTELQPGEPLEPPPPPFPAPQRTPNIGHTAVFMLFALGTVFLVQFAAVGVARSLPALHGIPVDEIIRIPRFTVLATLVAYLIVLGVAILIFPIIWQRSFAAGISWNLRAARRNAAWLIPLGFAVAMLSAVSELFQHIPRDLPVDKFFQSRADLWLVTFLGTLLAPAFEEICFRGFLLPAIAIAFDWSTLPRTPEALASWRSTDGLSNAGLVVGAVISSLGFALMHGKQLSYTIGPLMVLFCVSLALSAVRVRLRSVAASSLVHASYNGFLFLMTFLSTGGYRHLDKLTR